MEKRKESRLSVDLPGSYRVAAGEQHSMFFAQLSRGGCRLTAAELTLCKDDLVELYLGPVGPIAADVRWTDDGVAGVEFHEALDSVIVEYFAAFVKDLA